MGDDIQFGTESYQAMDSWSAGSESQTNANTSFLNGAPCSNGDCDNKENPAEEAWVKLVSAIPVVGQVQNLKCVAQGTAAPSADEVQSLVSDIRPDNPDNYALQGIAGLWRDFNYSFSDDPATAVASILRSKLAELSNGWQGDDFDAFAEQMEIVFANCEQIKADIGDGTTGMSGLLQQKGTEIFSLQGAASGELPYPAPQYWVEDKGGLFSNPKVHVRAPFKPGDCEVAEGCMFGDGDTEQAMELGGFDSEYTGELNQYMTDQTEYHYTRLKAEQLQASEAAQPADSTEDVKLTEAQESSIRAEAERLATEDANNRAAQDYDAADQDYEARATEQNETVVARWTDAESSASSFTPTVETSRDTTFRESAGDLDSAAYSPPGGGNFNTDLSSSGTSGLNSPSSTSTFGPGGNLSGGSNSGSTGGLNPWESSTGDDDDPSGGLASGGGLSSGTLTSPSLGTGTGMGAGGGGLGPGSGLFGPAAGGAGGMTGVGGAGGGRGGGAGSLGKGQGLFGKTAGAGAGGKAGMGAGGKAGGAGGMMGGGRGAGGVGDEEDASTGTWLTEDEDVWGLARFNDENDPLA